MNTRRLLSLDIFRGIVVAAMILVNDPGSWSYVYAPLSHASWHGLTPTDLIFPFFIVIMGISTYISLHKLQFQVGLPVLLKITKRTLLIFLIGLLITWFSLFMRTYHQLGVSGATGSERFIQAAWNIEHLRILGVLQRLALCYGVTALLGLWVKHRYLPYLIVIGLIGYFLLLVNFQGFEQNEQNILSVIDQAILGANHLYKDSGIALDPEGLVSTLSAICQCLLGFYLGSQLLAIKEKQQQIVYLFIVGAVLLLIGFMLSYGCPINKKIWSPTYVLVTSGFAATILALLVWYVDVHGKKQGWDFFLAFGMNPLFMYVIAALFSILLGTLYIDYQQQMISVGGYMYSEVLQPILGNYPGSFMYAILILALNWLVAQFLYKRQIYIKI